MWLPKMYRVRLTPDNGDCPTECGQKETPMLHTINKVPCTVKTQI